MDTTQTKVNAPHVRYNVKILMSGKNFERKLLGVVSRFS